MLGNLEVGCDFALFVRTLHIVYLVAQTSHTCKEDNVKFLACFFNYLARNFFAVFVKDLNIFCISVQLDMCFNRGFSLCRNRVVNDYRTFFAPRCVKLVCYCTDSALVFGLKLIERYKVIIPAVVVLKHG